MIAGAGGQLGTDMKRECVRNGDEVIALDRSRLDVTDRDAVLAMAAHAHPDVIINCAAWTAVDDCESDPDRAHQINGDAVRFLAEAATETGAHLVQVSTDYVFDGDKIGPYDVEDPPNPQSVYGASKLAGELAALAVDAAVVRTAWVFSAHGGNMAATVLRLAASHDTLRFVADQKGSPTYTVDLAAALRQVAQDRVSGLLHITNSGQATWHEFAQQVFEAAGLDPERVEPIATADLQPARPAPRPANSVLANTRYHDLGYRELPRFEDAVRLVVPAYL